MTALSKLSPELLAIVSSLNMVEGVAFTNRTFGKDTLLVTENTNNDEYWEAIRNQAKLVVEESKEMLDGIVGKSMKEIRDGAADTLVTALGLPHLLGFKFVVDGYSISKDVDGSHALWQALEWQVAAVKDRVDDLVKAVESCNVLFIEAAVESVVGMTLGVAAIAEFDADEDMREVFASNLTKVCPSEEDADVTLLHYANKFGVTVKSTPCPTFDGWVVKVWGTQVGTDGKTYPNNKFLKSVGNFTEPVFN